MILFRFSEENIIFSSLLAHLFLVFCVLLNAWCSESWHALMSLCFICKNNWRRKSLTFFFYIKKLSVLSCLTAVKLQWSFESWTAFYVIWAFYELTLMFLFLFKRVFWLFIVFFICKKASFLWNFVICFTHFSCLRFRTEFSLQIKTWNELQQWKKSDNFVFFDRVFF